MLNKLTKLNEKQLEAVKYTKGPLLVIAGAGSGKTRVISTKIAYLISDCGILARHITAITFTNKAAKEMLDRTQKLAQGLNTTGLTITTFHSLGLKILKHEAHHLGYKEKFSLLDSHDSTKIISDLAQTTDRAIIKSLQSKISLWKNTFITPQTLLESATDKIEQNTALIYQSYQDTLKTYQAMDFDDLIKLPIELFNTNLEVLYKWQQKIHYLLIDEYQDTNNCQYQLIKLLTSRNPNFTAVGDDDQSIYAWRGANVENLNNLQTDFKQLKIIKLEQNYRSTTTILNAANSVISNNSKLFTKRLWSEFGGGEQIQIISCRNDEDESETVVRKIMLHQLRHQTKFSDYAILYRSNHQARVLEQTLRNLQLPYQISGGQSFFDKTEIKDITSYLRLIVNNDDDSAFIRSITTPKRGIGQLSLEKLVTYAKNRKVSLFTALFEEGFAVSCNKTQLEALINFGNFINNLEFRMNKDPSREILYELITAIGYEEYLYEYETAKKAEKRMTNVLNFIEWIGNKSEKDNKKLPDMVRTIALISMLDEKNGADIDAINLSTLHAVKGLEYPFVYIISCEEGILPHQESINNNIIDEERRLMYVGITRAERELSISYCEQRRSGGELKTVEPSRFISELGDGNFIDELKHEKIKNNDEIKDRLEALKNMLNQ